MPKLIVAIALISLCGAALSSHTHGASSDPLWCDPRMERPCIESPPILATFEVGDEKFVAHVINPDAIAAIWQQ